MVDSFIRHISSKTLLNQTDTYLLACSGGLDSMCLANLLIQSEIKFEVAHVNFMLRGKESDEDEAFIKTWAKKHGKTLHLHQTETQKIASERGISTQMAARDIRYEWFETIRQNRNLAGIVLAHHEDDQLETIFLNLLRGTGIEGVYGMADRRGWLIRPLLPFSRQQILEYAKENKVAWREDSSNEKTDYKRNKLRHETLPAIYASSTDAKANLLTSFQRLKDTGKAFHGLFENWMNTTVSQKEGFQILPISSLISVNGAASLLYFWLRPYGFNSDQASAILQSCQNQEAGKLFQSQNYVVNVDREELILSKSVEKFQPISISENDVEFTLPEASYSLLKSTGSLQIQKSPTNASLDLERLSFPLEIRTWQEGDRFIPIGMKHHKKISDFLIDLKIPLIQKQSVKVLLSGDEIAWVIGYRIADWAKSTPATRQLIHFKKL